MDAQQLITRSVEPLCRAQGVPFNLRRAVSIAVHLAACGVRTSSSDELNAAVIVYWLGQLADLTDEQFSRGVSQYGKLNPPPYRHDVHAFRRAAGVVSLTFDDLAELAWSRVEQAMRSAAGRRVVFEGDPAIHAALRSVGGWASLCGGLASQTMFKRSAFLKAYVTALKVGTGDQEPLSGYVELYDEPVMRLQPTLEQAEPERLRIEETEA